MRTALRRLSSAERRAARDKLREERLDAVAGLVDRLLYDIARLCAGHSVSFDGYMPRDLARRVQGALRPMSTSYGVMRPDFGSHAELRVDGDLLDIDSPVTATIDFADRSTWEAMSGRLSISASRRVRLRGVISLQDMSVQALVVIPPASRT